MAEGGGNALAEKPLSETPWRKHHWRNWSFTKIQRLVNMTRCLIDRLQGLVRAPEWFVGLVGCVSSVTAALPLLEPAYKLSPAI